MALTREKEWVPCSAPTDFMAGCRRTASFPYFGDISKHHDGLKIRSHSACDGLNRFSYSPISISSAIDSLRLRTQSSSLAEQDEGIGGGSVSSCSSSSDECESPSLEPDNDTQLSVSQRKAVRFADDCGKKLSTVKVMTEASDQPPYLSPRILRRWKADCDSNEDVSSKSPSPWNMLFSQPVCDYVKFRETLENGKVSVENVFISPNSKKAMGTIKVSNIAFEKKVFVRYTSDCWKSYMDKVAVHQPSAASKIYDTFKFDIDLPSSKEQKNVEFCVCFVGNDVEYWDSNGGENYKLSCNSDHWRKTCSPARPGYQHSIHHSRDDAYTLEHEQWSKFASWKNLSTAGPYW